MTKELFSDFINWIKADKRKVLGGIVGFIFAILVLLIGFFKTLFIIGCVALGAFTSSLDNKEEKFKKLIKRIFSSPNTD